MYRHKPGVQDFRWFRLPPEQRQCGRAAERTDRRPRGVQPSRAAGRCWCAVVRARAGLQLIPFAAPAAVHPLGNTAQDRLPSRSRSVPATRRDAGPAEGARGVTCSARAHHESGGCVQPAVSRHSAWGCETGLPAFGCSRFSARARGTRRLRAGSEDGGVAHDAASEQTDSIQVYVGQHFKFLVRP